MIEPDFLRDTRAAYDAIAADYAERNHDELANKPLDRALLAAFAELVQGPVADLGCGHGHVTARLHALGLSVFGVDLSPRMVALARQAHPGLRFEQGSMTALDLPEGAPGGIVALHSIIHLPQERLPEVFAEFYRVLAPGGHVLLSFQVGDERVRRTEAFGHAISLDHYLRPPDRVAEFLSRAGFVEVARLVRERDEKNERIQPAFLLARKPAE
ncbi:class I SAM-dependent DNA methyltransferase [Nonomuraea sp. NPDC059194]|uniref:class I SAM-dependent DNA methyltransferase n=1 Tax=Nonomuraea sp. NPDC059194 TaxID=3346764 RepID=UPI0036BC7177